VDGSDLIGRHGARVLDGAGGGQIQPVDEDQHDVATEDR
jgi:hypothetical protein